MNDQLEFPVEQQFMSVLAQKWNPKLAKIVRAVEPEYLQADPYKWFIKHFQTYLFEHQNSLPWEYVDVLIHREFTDLDALAEMRRVIYLLYTIPITFGDQAITDFRQYLAWRVHSAGFVASRDGYRRSRDIALAIDHSRRAMDKANGLLIDADVHDLADDFELREADWRRERDNPGIHNRLYLGIKALDDQLRLDEGTLTAFLGPFKRYKSIVLNHCSIAGLACGFNVAQIVYENEVKLTEDRHYSRLGALKYDDMLGFQVDPEKYEQAREHILGLRSHLSNKLKIIKARPKHTTVADIEAQLDVLRQEEGFEADVTVWDYMNLIGLEKGRMNKEERINQDTIVWDLQAHAKDERNNGARRKIVITATQSKGDAYKKEHLDASDYGKSISIPQAVDCMIGINQTKQDKRDKKLRFSVLASRNSNVGDEVEVRCDMSWMCVALETYDWVADRLVNLFLRHA